MSYEFKSYVTLAGEDVEIVTALGLTVEGEIVSVDEAGYHVRVSKEGGQEYFVPKGVVMMISAKSRKVGGS